MRLSIVLAWVLAAAAALSADAAELTTALQLRLERAVQWHADGRLAAAQSAFEALARLGVPAAAYNLGVMHLEGEAGAGSARPNPRQARRWFERAAAQGFVTAQFALGALHDGARLGKPDLAAALRWYEQAAVAGSVQAQVAAGTAYYLGRGAARSGADALRWFREAAQGGDVGAMYLLASMYEQGDGSEVDLRLARSWYEAAAKNGDIAAPGKVREIDARVAAASGSGATTPP